MPGARPIPAPYDKYPDTTKLLFRRFYQSMGQWPWELVDYFEPSSWSAMLVTGLTKLLKIDLPNTPGVELKDVLNYLFEQSAHHRFPKYRNVLSNKVIVQATEWLQDKRDSAVQSQHQTRSTARNQRKRTFEILKLEDDQREENNSHHNDDNNVQVAPSHISKKRLMLYFKFNSIRAHDQLKTVGGCITVQGDENDKVNSANPGRCGWEPAQQSRPSNSKNNEVMQTESPAHSGNPLLAEESPFLDVTFKSLEDAQAAYAAYIKGQLDNCDNNIRRSQREIEATTQRQKEICESTRVNAVAREKASSGVSDAEKALKRANALCAAEDAVLSQVRHICATHGSVIPLDDLNEAQMGAGGRSEAQMQRLSAAADLAAKEKCLAEITEKLQVDHAEAAPLLSKVYDLCASKETEEKNQRTLTILSRLICMGPKLVEFLEEVLGDRDINEWTEEKLRQVEEAIVL
ncbi:hypothetical protein FHETE_10947 [Fusarium heterosporum]|uniref:Uncharacterized protein n=1 Tax=Fusarium heterosporum TaxID=42747 RepID=A0A8H5SRQ3_FUSHE|nr:hypothetical protein FHETE_10947 [Fusarium heterosporum]